MLLSRLLLTATMLFTGCQRVDRWDLSGNVTHGGKPIAEGHITFDPVGLSTGGGYARIANGKFDTRIEGRNHPGGIHKVMIAGYKGLKNPKNPDSDVVLMFPAYEVEIELPKKTATMDFDVPADWSGAK